MEPAHFIRDWRKYRGVTMARLADAMEMNPAVVSRIERGAQRYNQDFLEKAAAVLKCHPADLLISAPPSEERAILEAYRALAPSQRPVALATLKAFLGARPNDT